MHIVKKVKVFSKIKFLDIIQSNETSMVEVIGEERYKLFTQAFKEVIGEYIDDTTIPPKNIDIVCRTIFNDDKARYDRFYEFAISINAKNTYGNLCNMDFTFELFKMNDEEEERCELLTYYMTEFKKDEDVNE